MTASLTFFFFEKYVSQLLFGEVFGRLHVLGDRIILFSMVYPPRRPKYGVVDDGRICFCEFITRPFLPQPMVGYVIGLAVWNSLGSVWIPYGNTQRLS